MVIAQTTDEGVEKKSGLHVYCEYIAAFHHRSLTRSFARSLFSVHFFSETFPTEAFYLNTQTAGRPATKA